MLISLHMKNIALVREEEISFGKGLNILTGETGAGKSIIIGGVNAALGAASLKDYCSGDSGYALVELVFETDQEEVSSLLEKWDIPAEEGQIILSRKYQNGRTVNRINGETVPIGHIRELASLLIDIHGQHQHQSLLRPNSHRILLDRYAAAKLQDLPERCADLYHEYREKERMLQEASLDESQRLKQADLLRYEIREIEQASLQEGEDEELEQQFRIMNNGQKIMESLGETRDLVCSDEGALPLLSRAVRSLSSAASFDSRIREMSEQLGELESLGSDFERSLTDYMDSFEYDEQTFERISSRLDLINRLKMKYGRSIGEILEGYEDRLRSLDRLEHYERYLEELEKEKAKTRKELLACAGKISVIRKEEAKVLSEQITSALADLNFLDVQFEILVTQTEEPSASGTDDVVFCISLNPGMPLRPLQEVASGGELSRIMLAIKSIMADQDAIETLIFDEIDTGISGRTAQKVSEKMAVIAGSHQVICITHLAQIAAMADRHFLIEKHVEEGTTRTSIRALDGEEPVCELARIIGGVEITDTVIRSAREMRGAAVQTRERLRLGKRSAEAVV